MWVLGAMVGCVVSGERMTSLEDRVAAVELAHAEEISQLRTELEVLELRAVESRAPRVEPSRQTISLPDGSVVEKGPNHVAVKRADVAELGVEGLSKSVRWVPHRGPEGQPDGHRVSGIRRDSMVHQLGFSNGDVVLSVNERPLTSMAEMMEAYQALRDEDAFAFEISRRGERSTLQVDLVD